MDAFRQRYAALRAGWSGPRQGAYDAWVADANNAAFGAQAAYDDWVPNFEALFAKDGHNWPRFYAAVKHLASLPKAQRTAAVEALAPPASGAVAAAMIGASTDSPHDNTEHGGRGA